MRTYAHVKEELKQARKDHTKEKDQAKSDELFLRIIALVAEEDEHKRKIKAAASDSAPTAADLTPEDKQRYDRLRKPKEWFTSWSGIQGLEYVFDEPTKGLVFLLGNQRISPQDLVADSHVEYSTEVIDFMDRTGVTVRKIEQRDFDRVVTKWMEDQHNAKLLEVYEEIKHDPTQDDTELRKWYRLLTQRDVDETDLSVIKQVMVNTKRKLLGLPVSHAMMILLYSRENGTGKSGFLHVKPTSLMSPFTKGLCKEIDLELIGDQTVVNDWGRYLVYVVEEMAKSEKADMQTLKTRVTSPTVSGRQSYAKTSSVVPNRVTLWACSNKPVNEILKDERMRRFWQIDCSESKYVYRTEEQKAEFDAMDPLKMWRCVNEFDEAGNFEKAARSIDERQTDLCTPDPVTLWARDMMIVPTDRHAQVPAATVYQSYREWMEQEGNNYPVTNLTLGKRLKEIGVRSVLRTQDGRKVTMYMINPTSSLAVGHVTATSHITGLDIENKDN